jgi:hypothetical protein
LFGGAKCVAGNDRGPSIQSNYSDFLVKNRDYYYYKGKCYGNCTQSYGIKNTTGYGTENLYAKYSPSIIDTNTPTNKPSRSPPWNWYNWIINNEKWQEILTTSSPSQPVNTDMSPLTDILPDTAVNSIPIPT